MVHFKKKKNFSKENITRKPYTEIMLLGTYLKFDFFK